MTIEEMELAEPARSAAYLLQEQCPWIVFTSGRRDWYQQAHAMAVNTLRNRQWIGQVYQGHPQFQAWVDAHPMMMNVYDLAEGLYQLFTAMPQVEKDRFAHPAGRAFDVAPVLEPLTREQTVKAIYALPSLWKFLTREGGLEIWHVEFIAPVISWQV